MTFVDASMVRSDDEDAILINAGILCGLDNLAYITVQYGQIGVIFWCVVTGCMAYMIRIVEDESAQCRLLFLDIFHGHVLHFFSVNFGRRNEGVMVGRECIHHILDSVPFVDTTDFGFRLCVSQDLEHGREDVVLQNHSFWNFMVG